ncbi:DUF4105 domain-containing protein [Pseudomarimonas arenosa]|uniref:DUF4105 domain-containing protein n=1 Tax=Pseudomarimonas arenosa TaxID=2774145 RepID=A0AAW3ZNE1_9GAMM|nr:DUF4105 domain-containing protein [Pseudomarimonas arenosa]MBD8526147.1 DUF4105 domain-containing protein [Pseudomarimonas arenosa]
MLVRCLAVWLLFSAVGAQAAVDRIALVTLGPGEEYWARFGHNALMVIEDDGRATTYNYGFFDFSQPNFLGRFLRGHMTYQLVAMPADQDLDYYRRQGRSVRVQWLNLNAEERASLAKDLAWQAEPENAEYRYDYFKANCSTKVRDALDKVLGGVIRQQLNGRSRGLSYRDEALRVGYHEEWMYYGMHFGLGIEADQVMSRWDEAYIPDRFAEAIPLIKRADGEPLIVGDEQWLPQLVESAPAGTPRFLFSAAAIGFGLAALILLFGRHRGLLGTLTRSVLGAIWLFSGLAGLLMIGLWAFTDHSAAWANRNLLLFSPLAPLLLATLPALARNQEIWKGWRWLALFHLTLGAVAIAAYFLPVQTRQDNLEWILLMVPVGFGVWRLMRRTSEIKHSVISKSS